MTLDEYSNLNELLDHITPACDRLLARSLQKATKMGMPPNILFKWLVVQGYLNGVVDLSTAEHEEQNDLDARAYGEKLKLLLIPLRIELEAKKRKVQEQIAKAPSSRLRHRNNGS